MMVFVNDKSIQWKKKHLEKPIVCKHISRSTDKHSLVIDYHEKRNSKKIWRVPKKRQSFCDSYVAMSLVSPYSEKSKNN